MQFRIGQPAMTHERTGYLARVEDETAKIYSLGGGKMERQTHRLTIVWDNLTTSTVHEGIAAPWIERAANANAEGVEPDVVAQFLAQAQEAQRRQQEEAQREREAYAAKVEAWRDEHRDQIPADARAVIVAELEHDDSDPMTDYFNTKTSRTVLLAFSSHGRDLFPEMRKAARNFEETAHLADAPADAEHREKWSMGAGYYLKASGRYSDGWKVRKVPFYNVDKVNDRAALLPYGEWKIPAKSEATKAAPRSGSGTGEKIETAAETVAGLTISEHTHTKKGFQMWIVQDGERVARDVFMARLQKAKDRRGWYSRAWAGTPGGFAFKDQAQAQAFAAEVGTDA